MTTLYECPGCLGDGALDFSDVDAAYERFARASGRYFEPLGVQLCDWCDGAGVLTESQKRDVDAWATARTDQFLAAVDAGEVTV